MSEEEKEAIDILKQEPDYSLDYYKREKAIDIILKLVENQQKENKDLKSDRDYYKEMYYKIAFPEDEIKVYGLGVD